VKAVTLIFFVLTEDKINESEKAMPHLRLETATPTETEKAITTLEQEKWIEEQSIRLDEQRKILRQIQGLIKKAKKIKNNTHVTRASLMFPDYIFRA